MTEHTNEAGLINYVIEAPEDATIVQIGVPLGASATGPDGLREIYGGAALMPHRSADGDIYVPFVGERSGRPFGSYCFAWNPATGVSRWVDLPAFTEGRAGSVLWPEGLILAWPENKRNARIVQVPGFVTPGYPTSGQAPAPAPLPPTAPTPPSGEVVDEGARAYTSAVKKELHAAIGRTEQRIDAIAAHIGGAGLNAAQVKDIVWSMLADALYALLASDNAGIVGQLRRIVGTPQAPPASSPDLEQRLSRLFGRISDGIAEGEL